MLGVIFVMDKEVLKLIGFAFALGWSYLMVATFFVAFFSGSMRVVVTVNEFGEALIESIVLPIVLVFCTIMFVWFLVDFVKEAK